MWTKYWLHRLDVRRASGDIKNMYELEEDGGRMMKNATQTENQKTKDKGDL